MDGSLQKVTNYLDDLGWSYEVAAIDMLLLSQGSAMVMITIETCQSIDGTVEIVSIKSPILRNVEPSADLYKSISEINSSLPFGALVIEDTAGKGGKSGGKNTGVLFLKHSLLAQTLDKEEIEVGVGTMAVIADNLDDELQNEFGGQKAID